VDAGGAGLASSANELRTVVDLLSALVGRENAMVIVLPVH
jgi:hypothetical protein